MAKRKNATALFEVMAASRARRQAEGAGPAVATSAVTRKALAAAAAAAAGSTPGGSPHNAPPHDAPHHRSEFKPLGTPAIVAAARGWVTALLDKKPADAEPADAYVPPDAALDPNDPTAGMTARSLSSRGAHRPAAAPAEQLPEEPPAPAAGNRPVTYTTVMPTYGRSGPAAASDEFRAGPRNRVAIDRDRKQVTLRVRFNTAVIAGVAVAVVLGLAFIMGKRAGAPESPAARAPSSKEIKGGPVQPGVLDPQKRGTAAKKQQQQQQPASASDATLARDRLPAAPSAGIQPSRGAAGPVVTPDPAPYEDAPVTNGLARRTSGLNYCVIESYKPNQQEIALEVRDYLFARGVSCTVEMGSPKTRTGTGNYVLVGTRGFVKGAYGRSPEYQLYQQQIQQAAEQFGQKSKFNRPQTMMVKWAE